MVLFHLLRCVNRGYALHMPQHAAIRWAQPHHAVQQPRGCVRHVRCHVITRPAPNTCRLPRFRRNVQLNISLRALGYRRYNLSSLHARLRTLLRQPEIHLHLLQRLLVLLQLHRRVQLRLLRLPHQHCQGPNLSLLSQPKVSIRPDLCDTLPKHTRNLSEISLFNQVAVAWGLLVHLNLHDIFQEASVLTGGNALRP